VPPFMSISEPTKQETGKWNIYNIYIGACGSIVVKAISYKPEGRGFDTDEVNF
jgi:hypothetical protein